MTEKFSIVKQLDTEKLNEKIAEFFSVNGYIPDIFVNYATLESLIKPYEQKMKYVEFIDGGVIKKAEGLICKYQGYKMFEDNDLEFGEIELR